MTQKPAATRPRQPQRTTPQDGPPPSRLPAAVPPLVRRSQEAFRRALPQLLREAGRCRQWVAYHGETCLGFAASEDELYRECRRRGLADDEFVVRCVVPEVPAELDATPPFDNPCLRGDYSGADVE